MNRSVATRVRGFHVTARLHPAEPRTAHHPGAPACVELLTVTTASGRDVLARLSDGAASLVEAAVAAHYEAAS